jgi:hypothetical protein
MGSEAIYLVEGEGEFGELERAIGISVMGVGIEGRGTFRCDLGKGVGADGPVEFREQWLVWLQATFRDQVSEVFVKVFLASTGMRIDQIVELDNGLNSRLGMGENQQSREVGRWFLDGKTEMQRAPQWKKYACKVEQGMCPGHLVTVFALQAALYHLPLLSALSAYVYFEWRAAIKNLGESGGLAGERTSPRWFLQQYPESMAIVREVFGRNLQDWRAISGE